MEAVIMNFRQGRHTIKNNQMIIQVKGYDKEKAKSLLKKTAIFRPEGKQKKEIKGLIKSLHGNGGNLRVHFERGMPGQSIGKKLEIQ
jgi:large subunit ribosomal protein L35Ae